jgi:hypothetical protein
MKIFTVKSSSSNDRLSSFDKDSKIIMIQRASI